MVVVFTDLDGTLLEEDGSLHPRARFALDRLRARKVAVVPLTSKTRAELVSWLAEIGSTGYGSFENGAGVVGPGGVEILKGAVGIERLRALFRTIATRLAVPPIAIDDLSDAEVSTLTGLTADQVALMRAREFDLPFLGGDDQACELERELWRHPDVQLTRGGRFWHLHGRHDKGDACRLLKSTLRPAFSVGLGDAPNDAPFLRLVDRAVIVPGKRGPDERLRRLLPDASVAQFAAGEGWGAAVSALLEEAGA